MIQCNTTLRATLTVVRATHCKVNKARIYLIDSNRLSFSTCLLTCDSVYVFNAHLLTFPMNHGRVSFFFFQFLSNPAVTFGTAIAAFYLPVIIMTVLYIHISLASRSRVSKHKPEKKEKKGIK